MRFSVGHSDSEVALKQHKRTTIVLSFVFIKRQQHTPIATQNATDMLKSPNHNVNTYSVCYNFATHKKRAAKYATLCFI